MEEEEEGDGLDVSYTQRKKNLLLQSNKQTPGLGFCKQPHFIERQQFTNYLVSAYFHYLYATQGYCQGKLRLLSRSIYCQHQSPQGLDEERGERFIRQKKAMPNIQLTTALRPGWNIQVYLLDLLLIKQVSTLQPLLLVQTSFIAMEKKSVKTRNLLAHVTKKNFGPRWNGNKFKWNLYLQKTCRKSCFINLKPPSC